MLTALKEWRMHTKISTKHIAHTHIKNGLNTYRSTYHNKLFPRSAQIHVKNGINTHINPLTTTSFSEIITNTFHTCQKWSKTHVDPLTSPRSSQTHFTHVKNGLKHISIHLPQQASLRSSQTHFTHVKNV